MALLGCGYAPIYTAQERGKLHVVLVHAKVADAVAADEVLSGLREELAREGALEGGAAYPRIEVEVLRLDESSEGIAARSLSSGAALPLARGLEVGLVARAWVVAFEGAQPERDTGDMRAVDLVSPSMRADQVTLDASEDVRAHADALRAAGRRVGVRLARRVLGHPAASDDR